MNLRHLTHLIALADERHFARAAERVFLSQPAFSRSIQALEHQVGMRLFERDSGDVRPTPAGSFLIERARQLLFDARCVQRDLDLYRNTQLGDTAFGMGPFPASTLAQKVLSELRQSHPHIGIRVETSHWALLLAHLREEHIEFFVADIRGVPPDAALDIQGLGRQPAHFYVRHGHPLAGGAHMLRDVWPFGVAATRLPDVVKSTLGGLLKLPVGQMPSLALECDDVALLRAVTLSTNSILAATEPAVASLVASGELQALTISDLPDMYVEMGVVSLRNRTPSPMARCAIECFQRVAREVNS